MKTSKLTINSILLIVLTLILLAHNSYADNGNLELIRVTFEYPSQDIKKWIVIKQDGSAGTRISGTTRTVSWLKKSDGSVTTKPVAYVRGCTPRIGACFKKQGSSASCPTSNSAPTTSLSEYYAKAVVEGFDEAGNAVFITTLKTKRLNRAGQNDTYEYMVEPTEAELPNMILYCPSLKITWEWSLDEEANGAWYDAGASENRLYAVLETPVDTEGHRGYYHYLTLLHIGCKYAHTGTTSSALIDNVWEYFSNKHVLTANGDSLKYYGQWADGNLATNTQSLLQKKDGMCMAWTRFWLDVLKIQGFQQDTNFIMLKPGSGLSLGAYSSGFLMKKWTNNPDGTSGNIDYPFKNVKGVPFYLNNDYNWNYSEVYIQNPSDYLPAQNNKKPQSDFGNHIISKINNKYYDPSYGIIYTMVQPIHIILPSAPQNPETFNTLPELNSNISAYFITTNQDEDIYNIQVNYLNELCFIYIYISEYFPQNHH